MTQWNERSTLGVIRVADTGLSSAAAYRRCRPGGPWQRLFPGIILLHNGPPTRDQLVTAALFRAGPQALVTGPEACRRYGLRGVPPGDEVHVLVPHRLRGSGYLVVEREPRLPTTVDVGGFPLVPPARAVLDTCRAMRDVDSVTALVANAVQQGLFELAHLEQELKTGNRYGAALVRRAVRDLEQVRSVAEKDALKLSRRTGLTTEHWNVTIVGADGEVVGRPDAWFDDVGLAWEIDSRSFHFDPAAYARTLKRNTRYAAAGILVVQTLPARLRSDPAGVAEELRKAHRAASARPRPPVRVVRRA